MLKRKLKKLGALLTLGIGVTISTYATTVNADSSSRILAHVDHSRVGQSIAAQTTYTNESSSGYKWSTDNLNRTNQQSSEQNAFHRSSPHSSGYKWKEELGDAEENTNFAKTSNYDWNSMSYMDQAGYRWGIRSYAEQTGYRWGIRSNAEQSGYRWGIRSNAEQSGYRWGIRSNAEQSGYRWGIR